MGIQYSGFKLGVAAARAIPSADWAPAQPTELVYSIWLPTVGYSLMTKCPLLQLSYPAPWAGSGMSISGRPWRGRHGNMRFSPGCGATHECTFLSDVLFFFC